MAPATAAAGVDSPPVGKVTAQEDPALTRTPEVERAFEQLVTEADTPVDNIFSETQQLLLTGALEESWHGSCEGRSFILAANVGDFRSPADLPEIGLTALRDATQNSWISCEHAESTRKAKRERSSHQV